LPLLKILSETRTLQDAIWRGVCVGRPVCRIRTGTSYFEGRPFVRFAATEGAA
jgi:hypothetical protein